MRVVHIARCPQHGLHGRRDTCYECGGPVDQVAFVRESDAHDATLRVERLAIAVERLLERLPEHHIPGVGWLPGNGFTRCGEHTAVELLGRVEALMESRTGEVMFSVHRAIDGEWRCGIDFGGGGPEPSAFGKGDSAAGALSALLQEARA